MQCFDGSYRRSRGMSIINIIFLFLIWFFVVRFMTTYRMRVVARSICDFFLEINFWQIIFFFDFGNNYFINWKLFFCTKINFQLELTCYQDTITMFWFNTKRPKDDRNKVEHTLLVHRAVRPQRGFFTNTDSTMYSAYL